MSRQDQPDTPNVRHLQNRSGEGEAGRRRDSDELWPGRSGLAADEGRVAAAKEQIERSRKQLRRERRMTQRDVADSMGASQAWVSEIEGRDLSGTEVGTLEKWAQSLGGKIKIVVTFSDGPDVVLN